MVPPQVLLILCLQLFANSACGQLPETLQPLHSACYGTNFMFQPSCPSNDTVIAVKELKVGAKPAASTCPREVSDHTGNITDLITFEQVNSSCCGLEDGDCYFTYDTIGLPTPYRFFLQCTGLTECSRPDVVIWNITAGNCEGPFKNFTSYMFLEFYCIEDTRIGDMCGTLTANISGSAYYLQSPGYPNNISSTYNTPCSCSVQSSVCGDTINVYTVHVSMTSDGSTCRQTLTVNDNGTLIVWNCDNSTNFDITTYTSTSIYLQVELDNNLPSDDGYAWLGFQANHNDAVLMVNCPAIAETTCTTVTSTSGPEGDSEGGGGAGGGSIIGIIAGMVAGILFLIAMAILIYCCCCKKKKRENKVEPEKDKNDLDSTNDIEEGHSDTEVLSKPPRFGENSVAPANTHFNRALPPFPPPPLRLQETRYIMEHSGANQTITNDGEEIGRVPAFPPVRLAPIVFPPRGEEGGEPNGHLPYETNQLTVPESGRDSDDPFRSVTPGEVDANIPQTQTEPNDEKRKKKKKKKKKKKSKRHEEEDMIRLEGNDELENTEETENQKKKKKKKKTKKSKRHEEEDIDRLESNDELKNTEETEDQKTCDTNENKNEESNV